MSGTARAPAQAPAVQQAPAGAVAAALDEAAAALSARAPDAARQAAQRAAALDPRNPVALCHLASAELLAGHAKAGLAAARRAVAAAPGEAEAHFILGLALRENARPDAAAGAYRAALARDPGHLKALNNLATYLMSAGPARAAGALAEAERLLRRATEVAPYVAQSHNNLGLALQRLGRPGDAEASFRRAMIARPDYAQAYYNCGVLVGEQLRLDDAEALLRTAVRLRPDFADARDQLGRVLLKLKRPEAALEQLLAAHAARPEAPTLPLDIGIALVELDRYDEAEPWLRQAAERQPALPQPWMALGHLALRRRDKAAAVALLEKAVAVAPDYPNAHFILALMLLTVQDFRRGWVEHEWRWKADGLAPHRRDFAQPLWLGDAPLAGRTILLYQEQGFGDAIQFSRYIPLLAAAGGRVVLEVLPDLLPLFRDFPGVAELVARPDALPRFDLQCPLMSLPLALGTTPETIPPPVPFAPIPLPTPGAPDAARAPDAPAAPLRVGVAWSGNPLHDDDRRRSIPLDKFARLFGIPGVTVAILQKFRREADAAILAAHPSLDDRVRDASDFAATAAVVAGLDLVISIDSAVAHLAGTLGVPVWVLLPHTCDWRWDTGRADTPWYPSAKLYRQPRVGDWDSVLDEVARALHARAETAAGGGVA